MVKKRANSDSFRVGESRAIHASLLELTEENVKLSQTITEIRNSLSWKVTTPLRGLLPRAISLATLPKSIHRVAVGLGGYRRSVILAAHQIRRSGLGSAALELKSLLSKKAQNLDLHHRYHASFTSYLRPVALSICERNSISKEPLFSVIMPTFKPNLEWLKMAIESLQQQAYQNLELIIVDDGNNSKNLSEFLAGEQSLDSRIRVLALDNNLGISGATNAGISIAKGDLVAFMDHDDLLEAHALTMMALAFEENPKCKFGYSDEDKVAEDGRYFSPHFKPSYDPVLLLQINYISHFTVFRSDFLRSLGPLRTEFDGLQDHELLLRAAAKSGVDQVFHIPHVLYHWRAHSASTASVADAKGSLGFGREIAATEFLNNIGLEAVVTQNLEIPLQDAATSVSLRCDEGALVSIVIPTKNQFELLRKTIESIRLHTSYQNYEIVIVDNGSEETDAVEYLAHLENCKSATVLRSPEAFNFSKLVNLGVENSRGELICLLNNDIEILSGDWMGQMVAWAKLPGVGAVGSRLWYPDRRLQHGGVILGVGGLKKVAGHAHKYYPVGNPGYMGRAATSQIFSAVTGACLMVRKATYKNVEGFNEKLKVAFNDVDFCLKIMSSGLQNIWLHTVSMVHHESASRGIDSTPSQIMRAADEVEQMLERWGTALTHDLSYHPLLSHESEGFEFTANENDLDLLMEAGTARVRNAQNDLTWLGP